jgi:hypothetical protein
MAEGKIEQGRYLACCEVCGRWQEIKAAAVRADRFFSYWQGEFCCCRATQTASFTLEKEDDDIH